MYGICLWFLSSIHLKDLISSFSGNFSTQIIENQISFRLFDTAKRERETHQTQRILIKLIQFIKLLNKKINLIFKNLMHRSIDFI